jgi:hypothetical protein
MLGKLAEPAHRSDTSQAVTDSVTIALSRSDARDDGDIVSLIGQVTANW